MVLKSADCNINVSDVISNKVWILFTVAPVQLALSLTHKYGKSLSPILDILIPVKSSFSAIKVKL